MPRHLRFALLFAAAAVAAASSCRTGPTEAAGTEAAPPAVPSAAQATAAGSGSASPEAADAGPAPFETCGTSREGGTVVEVEVSAPGYSAIEASRRVAEPLEAALMGVSRVRHVVAESTEGAVTVRLSLDAQVDVWSARTAVLDRLTAAVPTLPTDVEAPVLRPRGAHGRARYTAVITGDLAATELSALADELRYRLLAVPGVADAEVRGAAEPRLEVRLNPARLAAYGVTGSDVVRALAESNVALPAGSLDVAGAQVLVAVEAGGGSPSGGLEGLVSGTLVAGVPLGSLAEVESGVDVSAAVAWDGARAAAVLLWLADQGTEAGGRDLARAIGEARAAWPPRAHLELVDWERAPALTASISSSEVDVERLARVLLPLGEDAAGESGVVHVLTLAGTDTFPTEANVAAADRGEVRVLLDSAAGTSGENARRALGEHLEREWSGATPSFDVDVDDGRPRLTVTVSGDDAPPAEAARTLAGLLAEGDGVDRAFVAEDGARPVQTVAPDRARLARLGVTVEDFTEALRLATVGVEAASPMGVGAVVVRASGDRDGSASTSLADLSLTLRTATAGIQALPLAELATIRLESSPALLRRVDGRPAAEVVVVLGRAPDAALCGRLEETVAGFAERSEGLGVELSTRRE